MFKDINKSSDEQKYSFYKIIKDNKLKKSDKKIEIDDDDDNYKSNKKIVISIKCLQSLV